MLNLRCAIGAMALAAYAFLAAGSAHAFPVTGSSSGGFSSITSCEGVCNISPDGKVLTWGNIGSLTPGSTLASVNRSWNVLADGDDVVLAELVWNNVPTAPFFTPTLFNAVFNLDFTFTAPNATGDSQGFDLSILNVPFVGDIMSGLSMSDLSGLHFSLDGITVSDLKFQLATGPGTFIDNIWYNPEAAISRMYISADFTRVVVAEVPEPASLTLFGAGLFGLAMLRRRMPK